MYWKSFRGLKTKFSITYISWCPYQHFGKDGKKHSYFLPMKYRSSSPEVSLRKDHLKICSKFTRKHPWRSVFSIKVACNFIETALRHGFSWVATWGLQLYYKRDCLTQTVSCEFCEIFKNSSFYRTLPVAASKSSERY